MNYLEIKLWKCQNATSGAKVGVTPGVICQTQDYIDSFLNNQTFNFAFVNGMFAIKNYT